MRCSLPIVALLLASCATTAEPVASAAPTTTAAAETPSAAPAEQVSPTVVYLVRHAEKADDGTKNPPLTVAGTARAECLGRMFASAGVTHLYSTDLQRTELTVTPLAKALGLEVETLEAGNNDALLERLDGLPPGSVAVVAGHSNTVPAIAAELGTPLADLDGQGYIPHEQYDRLVSVIRSPSTTPKLVELRYCAPSSTSP